MAHIDLLQARSVNNSKAKEIFLQTANEYIQCACKYVNAPSRVFSLAAYSALLQQNVDLKRVNNFLEKALRCQNQSEFDKKFLNYVLQKLKELQNASESQPKHQSSLSASSSTPEIPVVIQLDTQIILPPSFFTGLQNKAQQNVHNGHQ
jgi:hypothetical protein